MSLNDYVDSKPVLETKRLMMRAFRESDIPRLREWMSDKKLYAYWGKGPAKSDKNPELMFEKQRRQTKSFHWCIATCDGDVAVGEMWIYLIENDRMAKIALRIAPDSQGKGFATEAMREAVRFCFRQTELQRIWTDVDVRNTASWKALESCGFRREGLIRQGKMVNTWCDYYIYGILKEDENNIHP